MTAPRPVRVERARQRRGAFGLDDRRRPDPARVEAGLRAFLAARVPAVWPLAEGAESGEGGRTLALMLPHGRVAVLLIGRDRDGPEPRALAARCRALRIPHAAVTSLAEARAALRRFGVEPSPGEPSRDAPAKPGEA